MTDVFRYVGFACYVVLVYDHALTLSAEVEYIWKNVGRDGHISLCKKLSSRQLEPFLITYF